MRFSFIGLLQNSLVSFSSALVYIQIDIVMIESTKMSTIFYVYSIVTSYNFLGVGAANCTEGKHFNVVCMSVCENFKDNFVMMQRTNFEVYNSCVV